jgi:hypothetical protein
VLVVTGFRRLFFPRVLVEHVQHGVIASVPLTAPALKVLDKARERYGNEGLIFPGMRRGRPISDVSLAKAIARHTDLEATTHGFRSTFRD